MKLTETHHFCVRKSLLSGNVFSPTSASSTLSIQVCIFSLNMDDIVIYVARWCQKYLSKSSLFKHTCSWRDKLIIFLWSIEKMLMSVDLTSIGFDKNANHFWPHFFAESSDEKDWSIRYGHMGAEFSSKCTIMVIRRK